MSSSYCRPSQNLGAGPDFSLLMCSQGCESLVYTDCPALFHPSYVHFAFPFQQQSPGVSHSIPLFSTFLCCFGFGTCLIKWHRAGFCFAFVVSPESHLLAGEFNSFTFIVMTDVFGPTPATLFCTFYLLCFLFVSFFLFCCIILD